MATLNNAAIVIYPIKIDESELRSRAIIVKIFLRIRFLKQRNIFHAARSGAPLQQLRRDLIRTVQVFKGPRGRSIAGDMLASIRS